MTVPDPSRAPESDSHDFAAGKSESTSSIPQHASFTDPKSSPSTDDTETPCFLSSIPASSETLSAAASSEVVVVGVAKRSLS